MSRLAALLTLVAVLTMLPAAPALAHGGGGVTDASNFASTIGGVVTLDENRQATGPGEAPGVSWRVLANDALLEVTNTSGTELLVSGYENEPYLRMGPDGVWENRNSPATYLNNDRFGQTPVPERADAQAEPDWIRRGDGPTYRWHDHRIHWMATTMPPQVKVDPNVANVVLDWTVPFTIDGERLGLQGQLNWVPGPSAWPWLLAGLALVAPPVLLALRRPPGAPRRRALRQVGVLLLTVVAGIDLVHAVDDLVAVPATLTENLSAGSISAAILAIAALGIWKGREGRAGAATALSIGAAVLVAGVGLTHLPSLTSSQVATLLPVSFTRAVVALNLALIMPMAIVAWKGQEPWPDAAEQPQPATAAPAP